MKTIYLVRHGETDGNLQRFFQSESTALADAGHKGARAVAERLEGIEVDQIIASHFVRAQQTAGYISEVKRIPVTTVEAFHEKLRPKYLRGTPHDSEAGLQHIEEYKTAFWSPDWNDDGAENYFDVMKRVKLAVEFIEASPFKNIVVVSHGDYIKLFTTFLLLQKNDDVVLNQTLLATLERMSNVAITRFSLQDTTWTLSIWNDHAHFAE